MAKAEKDCDDQTFDLFCHLCPGYSPVSPHGIARSGWSVLQQRLEDTRQGAVF